MDYVDVGIDAFAIILSIGAFFYLYHLAMILKGGTIARGVTLIAISPLLIALSAFLELLEELGIGEVYGILHDFARVVFVLVLLVGARSIFLSFSRLGERSRPHRD